MRRGIDPAVLAELETVEAVLAGTDQDADITAIATGARAEAATMTPAFAARLDAAVASGFAAEAPAPAAAPRGFRRRLALPRALPRPRPLALAGGLATALVAIVVAASALDSGGGTSPAPQALVQRNAAGGGSASSSSAFAPASPTTERPTPDAAAPSAARRVQRAAELTISTPVGRLQDTADSVAAVADRLGGYVARSDATATGDGGQATFDLRIPVSHLDDALAAISRLGHVRSRSQQSTDVTGAFNAARARLHGAEGERDVLLRALATASTPLQVDSLKARLRIVRGQIASAQRTLTGTERAADQARVAVTVVGVAQAGAAAPSGHHRWTPGRAVHDALGILSALLGALIVALAAGLPVLLAGVAVAFGVRSARRRRREHLLHTSLPV